MLQKNFSRYEGAEVICLTRRDLAHKFLPRIPSSVQDRVKKNVFSKFMYSSKDGSTLPDSSPELLRETRFIPFQEGMFEGEVSVLGDTISMVSYSGSNLHGVVIESNALADTLRYVLELAWKELSKDNNKKNSKK